MLNFQCVATFRRLMEVISNLTFFAILLVAIHFPKMHLPGQISFAQLNY